MNTRLIDDTCVRRGSANVYADLALADADKLHINAKPATTLASLLVFFTIDLPVELGETFAPCAEAGCPRKYFEANSRPLAA